MHLVVWMSGGDELAGETRFELAKFSDQDKVAARIARTVRNWIRVVPVRNSGSRLDLRLTAEWMEGSTERTHTNADLEQVAPPRRKKKKARK